MDNQQLIQGIKIFGFKNTLKYNDGLQSREYTLKNGPFKINIAFGDVFWSEPPNPLPLENYKKVCVSLYDFKKDDRLDQYFPIDIPNDVRFNAQGWDMVRTQDLANKGFGMLVSLDTMCDMIRYCYRLIGMKAFW